MTEPGGNYITLKLLSVHSQIFVLIFNIAYCINVPGALSFFNIISKVGGKKRDKLYELNVKILF